MGSAGSTGETVHAIDGFGPPPIEDGKIQAAMQHNFLAARARSFQRTAGIVEPDIDALHKVAPDVDVIVLDEHEFVAELGIAHQLGNLLQNALAGLVEGLSLALKYEFHLPPRIMP